MTQTMHVSRAAFERAWARLASCYPQSLPDEPTIMGKMQLWADMLSDHHWITDQVFEDAVAWACWNIDDFLPTPAKFLEICRDVAAEGEREAQKALPPPAVVVSRPAPADFLRGMATGKARARKRFALIDAWRLAEGRPKNAMVPEAVWRGQDEPTEAEITAALHEMGAAVMPDTPMANLVTELVKEPASGPLWPGATTKFAAPQGA